MDLFTKLLFRGIFCILAIGILMQLGNGDHTAWDTFSIWYFGILFTLGFASTFIKEERTETVRKLGGR